MIIKVCGIKTEENIQFLAQANIDMIGLNFYKPSVRYVAEDVNPNIFDVLPQTIKKVGVFVNESISTILEKRTKYDLDYIQLHGDEGPEYCNELAKQIPIIKVFRVDENFDFKSIANFDSSTYFLFDTKTNKYGGSGKKFDWSILNEYNQNLPFLVSGGIGPNDVEQILNIRHPYLVGVDINSKFESTSGIKDKNLVLPFINKLKVK
jgi:phosphoribosylanthranilate isomerase